MGEKIVHRVMTSEGVKGFEEPITLELGCGFNKKQSWYTGIDKSPYVGADICMNFGITPLPFPDQSIDCIYTAHTFEHLSNDEFIFAMNESFRVLKFQENNDKHPDRGKMWIHVPHMDCELAWQDPTHKRYFNRESMKFFCGHYIVKYALDYGISAIFYDATTDDCIKIIDPDRPNYCKMIEFLLLKDRGIYNKYRDSFPFKKPNLINKKQEKTLQGIEDKWFNTTNYKTDHNNHFNNELKQIAKHAINKHLKEILDIKIDATNRYGIEFAPNGKEGLISDILRKLTRTLNHYKDGTLTSENIRDTLYDGAVYFTLAAIWEEEMERIRLRGEQHG